MTEMEQNLIQSAAIKQPIIENAVYEREEAIAITGFSLSERGLSRCVTQVCCCPGIQQYLQVRDRPEVGCLHKRAPPQPDLSRSRPLLNPISYCSFKYIDVYIF
jgi:hypothetical protein